MTEMQEALAAIETRVQLAPEKIPAGSTLIGIKLERDEGKAGRYVEAIGRNWQSTGWAVAIKDGHVVAANAVFGRFTNGAPKVTAMHWCCCASCGRQVPMPVAVWQAKDEARKAGTEVGKDMVGIDVLRSYGKCQCGGRWAIDDSFEKESLDHFASDTLKAFSMQDKVSPFLPPTAFLVGGAPVALDPEWGWLQTALSNAGKTVAPFEKDKPGSVLIYNPGMWLGYVENRDDTQLFWVENGKTRQHRERFNPQGIEGL
jgi:hypothetical protein